MAGTFEQVYRDVSGWGCACGIRIREGRFASRKAGEFDGVSATMNDAYDAAERTYYLAHALGSIVRWSLSRAEITGLFDELRTAKKDKASNPARLERAIKRYRDFEIQSSEFAVWLLAELGHAAAIPSYTNFMRADLEALTAFHRSGRAPVWRDFFAHWNAEVESGSRQVIPYVPRPIPAFTPVRIENQEIVQEQGEGT